MFCRLATHHRPGNVKLPGALRHLTLLYIYIYQLIFGTLCLVEFAAWYLQNRLLCRVSLALKMAQKKLCPRTPKKKKKSSSRGSHPPAILTATAPLNLQQGPVGQVTQNTSGTGSHHCNQKLNQWDVQKMKNALEELCYWEDAYRLTYRFGCCPLRLTSCLLWGLHSCPWRLSCCLLWGLYSCPWRLSCCLALGLWGLHTFRSTIGF